MTPTPEIIATRLDLRNAVERFTTPGTNLKVEASAVGAAMRRAHEAAAAVGRCCFLVPDEPGRGCDEPATVRIECKGGIRAVVLSCDDHPPEFEEDHLNAHSEHAHEITPFGEARASVEPSATGSS